MGNTDLLAPAVATARHGPSREGEERRATGSLGWGQAESCMGPQPAQFATRSEPLVVLVGACKRRRLS